ncbi:hypothetical protein [Parerythrobacter lacustris]|uniref:Tetratricopeptide repeat protein n=1 Tax=Parerythrobacter lacustris TaxID=2969984 RepID=A0ABT1XSY1_9SPHN|nr:hypothetical protein [Parerythrobacter lacustris]MCR2834389.1 hypothetical protein [Parerythrobacter lacustris]
MATGMVMARTRRRRSQPFSIDNPGRLIAAALVCAILAGVLALQAVSSVSTRKAPGLAAKLYVPNGLAAERAMSAEFTKGVKSADDVAPSAKAVAPLARAAFRKEGLTPKAHAILALAETDPAARAKILAAATRINRRDLLLQGMVLEQQVGAGDFKGSLTTLDRLLKVHPQQQAALFPVLIQALNQDAALPAFAQILDGSAPWHNDFLDFAVRNKTVLPGLGKLRLARKVGTDEFDRKLVVGLAENGQLSLAYDLFQAITGKTAQSGGAGPIDWNADFAPFDWKFADEGGFRAQLARTDGQMEIYVRGGKGGLIAERLIRAPAGRFAIKLNHRISPIDQIRDVRLQLRCAGSSNAFYDERFERGENLFAVGTVPANCGFLSIGIQTRAWSGQSALRGTINRLEIVRLRDAANSEAASDRSEGAETDTEE